MKTKVKVNGGNYDEFSELLRIFRLPCDNDTTHDLSSLSVRISHLK